MARHPADADPRPLLSRTDLIVLALFWLALMALVVWAYATGG